MADKTARCEKEGLKFSNVLASLCTLKTAYTKHLKYVKRKIETKRGAVEIPVSYTHLGKGQLIVVDGGWTEDADFVRQTIKEMGGKVDAWILTHPHQDHIGAFNAIYSDLQGIEIKEVYTVDMPSPKLCQERAHWDSVDTYNDFLDLNVKNLKYVYPGDELNICGLKVDIYNAYDEHVKELSQDYLNDGSMMFKVQGEKSSMLFCADVGKAMSDYPVSYTHLDGSVLA